MSGSSTDRFLRLHEEHAHLLDEIVAAALELATVGGEEFIGHYGRLLAHREPALRSFLADFFGADLGAQWDEAGNDLSWIEEAA